MKNKKMLAILGSPRKEGNISKLLNIAISEAGQLGHEVEIIDVYEKNISPCSGCMSCRASNKCVISDDIQDIEKAFVTCDYVVLAAPTYWANMPAPVKNMFDRLVYAFMDDNNSSIPKAKLKPEQKYIIIVSCNTPAPFDRIAGQSSGCVKNIKEILSTAGMKYSGKFIYPGVRNKPEISKKEENRLRSLIQKMR